MPDNKGLGEFKAKVYRAGVSTIAAVWFGFLLSGCGGAAVNGGSADPQASLSANAPLPASVTVTITSPSSSGTYLAASSNLTVAGSAAASGGNIAQVTWTNCRGGSGIAGGTAAWTAAGIALQAGTNVINVTARDTAGNTGSASLTVTYNAGAANTGAASGATYYLSPTGNDGNDGRSPAAPWKTFAHAFATMAGGDTLILLDGVYGAAQGTGYMSYLGANSAQPPSGLSVCQPTVIRALNPGSVTVVGNLFIGRSFRKDSFITIRGLTFEGGADLYNTSYVTLKDVGVHGALGIGTNDHNDGNSYALLEDVWAWGNERIAFIVYRSDHIVVRRAVFRNDGCIVAGCSDSGNAVVGTAIYNSHDVSFQNVIVLDSVLGPNGFGGAGDFMATWHNNFFFPWHRNEWLGSMSINSQLGPSFFYDIDNLPAAAQPMATYRNIVAWNAAAGFAANMNCGTGCAAHNITVHNATLETNGSDDGLWINSNLNNGVIDVKNIVAFGGGTRGVSSPTAPRYINVNGFSSPYEQSPCVTGCYTSNPIADGLTPSLRHPIRIETGSFLKGKGENGADIGANIVFRYGTDGTRHGEAGYNTLTSVPLWPWPNEARIRREMCAATTRGFCTGGQRLGNLGPVTLTTYVWELLNVPIPLGLYP